MLATYGMFPIASLVLTGVQSAAIGLENSGFAQALRLEKEAFAFYINSLTFLVSAVLLFFIRTSDGSTVGAKFAWRISEISRELREVARRLRSGPSSPRRGAAVVWRDFVRETREGWGYVFGHSTVRPIGVGLATGLIGGGMLVPLVLVYLQEVVGVAEKTLSRDFGYVTTGLGVGIALGVGVLLFTQQKLNKELIFAVSVLGAGACLILAVSLNTLIGVILMAGALGVCAGGVYVLGFTLLHSNTADELRGRVFAGLNSVVRLCLVLALVLGPLLSSGLDALSNLFFDGALNFGFRVELPGVRLTLWLAGALMVAAGFLVRRLQKESAVAPPAKASGLDASGDAVAAAPADVSDAPTEDVSDAVADPAVPEGAAADVSDAPTEDVSDAAADPAVPEGAADEL